MEKEIFARLIEVIDRDERSDNKISTDAGLGRNFVQQLKKTGRTPGIDRLMMLLNTLGRHSTVYILTGLTVDESDVEALELISALPQDAKQNALAFFRSLSASAES